MSLNAILLCSEYDPSSCTLANNNTSEHIGKASEKKTGIHKRMRKKSKDRLHNIMDINSTSALEQTCEKKTWIHIRVRTNQYTYNLQASEKKQDTLQNAYDMGERNTYAPAAAPLPSCIIIIPEQSVLKCRWTKKKISAPMRWSQRNWVSAVKWTLRQTKLVWSRSFGFFPHKIYL